MTFFNLARLTRKSAPSVASNESFDTWYHQARTQSSRLVHKVEMCTALVTGDDAWGTPVTDTHHHTLLRVSLAPISDNVSTSEDTFLLERVLSTGGAYHSVVPAAETFTAGGTLFHPDIHDRISIFSNGPRTSRAPRLIINRTLTFGSSPDETCLTLAQLAQVLEYVSRMTALVCDGGDCRFQSRSFAFTCLAALAPSVPPPISGEIAGVQTDDTGKVGMVNDSVFELGAETFLGHTPWLITDPALLDAAKLIKRLKDVPRERVETQLYH